MSELLQGLNPEQVKAVLEVDGPVLVLAGAGSGKTKALTHRIAYLVREREIGPDQILAITFTNKAAEEMKNRYFTLVGQTLAKKTENIQISTFHAFCAKLLRVEAGRLGYTSSFSILAADDQLTAVKQAMLELNIDAKKIFPEAVRANISSAKNELLSPIAYKSLASSSFQQTVAQVYEIYQEILRRSQSMDFDDLLMLSVELFRNHPERLDRYQERFRYILVDEYQDTNTAQYELVKLLSDKYRNLFVVGDDWQSIYSWRGANFQNILNFQRDYADAKVIKLEQNYRSTQNILDAAHAVIIHNQNRSDKQLWTEQKAGELITVYEALNERAEGDFIIREIDRLRAQGASLSDMAILYRTNAQSRSLEEMLIRAAIPYRVIGGVRFYERKEIRDMVAWLTLLINPDNNLALMRIINVPTRGIGKRTVDNLAARAEEAEMSMVNFMDAADNLSAEVQAFGKLMKTLNAKTQKMLPSKIIDLILDLTGYMQMLKDEGIEGETRLENIFELKSVMEKYDHLETQAAIATFLEEVSLISDIDNYDSGEPAITLMTIHSSKGLEFDHVFIAGAEENLFPHSRSLFDQAELEEERRLCYVAITRARKKVYFVYTKERLIYGSLQNNPPSRFIADIPEELTELVSSGMPRTAVTSRSYSGNRFKPGTKVVHKIFGQGVIISRSADILTVAFTKEGIKQLAAELSELKIK